MRNLHTYNNSGLEFEGSAPSIGRGSTLNQLQAGKFKDAVASAKQGNSNRSFSHESKWSVMSLPLCWIIRLMIRKVYA